MKLLSWNIDFSRNNINDVVELILQEDPDIVCLQEMLAGLDRNVYKECRKKRILDTELDVVYRFKFFGPNYETYPYVFKGKKIDTGGLVQQGNYILSKCKFINAEQIFYYGNYKQMREDDWKKIPNTWTPSSMQIVDVEAGAKKLRVINNHGLWTKNRIGDSNTEKESAILTEYLQQVDTPGIATGDFNLIPESKSFNILANTFDELVTSHGSNITARMSGDDLTIDYVFTNKLKKIRDFRIIDTDVSDHLPLIAEFEI